MSKFLTGWIPTAYTHVATARAHFTTAYAHVATTHAHFTTAYAHFAIAYAQNAFSNKQFTTLIIYSISRKLTV